MVKYFIMKKDFKNFFHNDQELKHFFKTQKNIHLKPPKYKNIKLFQ